MESLNNPLHLHGSQVSTYNVVRNHNYYKLWLQWNIIIIAMFLNTGDVSRKKYNKDNLPRKVNESILFLILQVVLDHLPERGSGTYRVSHCHEAASTICKALHDFQGRECNWLLDKEMSRYKQFMLMRCLSMIQKCLCFSIKQVVTGGMPWGDVVTVGEENQQ